jgi:hypothetical protein
MNNVSQRLGIIFLVLTALTLLQACAGTPKLPKPKPGLYVNEEYRFSVSYPEHWAAEPVQPGEVLRIANPTRYKLPVMTAAAADLREGATLDPVGFTEAFKQAIPGTKQFRIHRQQDVKLNDGTPAKAMVFTWTWTDGSTEMLTAALITIKEDKFFNTTATTVVGGDTTAEQLLEMVKSWKFY